MIVPSDEDYVETKLVKLGRRSLPPVFETLADWIAEYYRGVTVLNVRYDKVAATSEIILPRLSVIFEWKRDAEKFHGPDMNYDRAKQASVTEKFREIIAERRDCDFDTNRLLVIFCAFEPVARLEAIWRVTDEQIATFKAGLANPAIWEITKDWEGIVIFFYTDAQLKTLGDAQFKARCSSAFAEMIGAYDEFGYFRDRPATISLDSKENFDTNYEGNWFNYDRR